MVLDSQWRDLERQVKQYGECQGCEEPILEGEEYYEIDSINHERVMVHKHMSCCSQFLNEIAISRIAGE